MLFWQANEMYSDDQSWQLRRCFSRDLIVANAWILLRS